MSAPADLTVAVAAGPRVARSLAACARVVPPGSPADLAIVEPGHGAPVPGIPSAAWLRDPATAHLADLSGYDAVFVTDPALSSPTDARTARRPAPVPDAASSDALTTVRSDSLEPWLAILSGAHDDWDGVHVMAAASGFETRVLPEDPVAAAGALSRCAALIATHSARGSQLEVPGAVFDAVAMRTPVVVGTNRGAQLLLTSGVPRAAGRKQAARLVAAAVEQRLAPEVGARTVRHAHTYAHRLATIASALGLRVLPPAV